MIKFFTSLLGLGGKALDRILPDRARLQEKNLEINGPEHGREYRAPGSQG